MKNVIVESISNIIFCRLKEALNLSGLKKFNSLEFFYNNGKIGVEEKVFGILEVNGKGVDKLKLGMFLQAFSLLLEKDNIPIIIEKRGEIYSISVCKPAKIIKKDIKGGLNLKIDGKEKRLYCRRKPEKVYRHRIKVRFRDLDAMGHVSNNVFLVYLEESRVGFRNFIAKNNNSALDFCSVVASHSIEYIAPIFLGEELEVEVFISHMTEKSYRFNYRILNRKTGELKAEAFTQMIGYDYKKQVVKPLSQEFIDQMRDYIV